MKMAALSSPALGILGILMTAAVSQAAILVDFNTAGDLAGNFRQTYNPTETDTVQVMPAGYVSTSATSLSSGSTLSESFIYDTTPANGTVKNTFTGPVTISMDIRAAQSSSFGIYIVDPSETNGGATHRLALFNFDNSGTSDQIRIFSTSSISNAQVGTAVYNNNTTNIASLGSQFVSASLTYRESSLGSGHAIMNFTVNGVSSGDVDLGAGTYLSSFEVGVRLYDSSTGAGAADMDNFAIVPEPSTMALASLGLVFLGVLRRRRKAAQRN